MWFCIISPRIIYGTIHLQHPCRGAMGSKTLLFSSFITPQTSVANYMYSAYTIFEFLTLMMYCIKRVDIKEVPFGYDEIQQNCHQFCSELSSKKCVLIFRKSLSDHLPRRPLCVIVSKFRGNRGGRRRLKWAWRSTSRRLAGWGKLLLKVTKLRYTSYSALVTGSSITVLLLSFVIDLTKQQYF